MSNPQSIKRRILALYIAFFAVLVAGIVFGATSERFNKGYLDGQALGERITRNYLSKEPRSIKLLYDLPNKNREMNVAIPGLEPMQGVNVTARINTIDLLIETDASDRSLMGIVLSSTGSAATLIFSYLIIGCYLAILVLIFLIVDSLRRSMRSENIFERRNIRRTRAIGVCILLITLFETLMQHSIVRNAESILAGSDFVLDTSVQIGYWNIIIGILFLFIAEVFAIGYDMSQEQKLTI